MFIHPVHIILFLSIFAVASLGWIYVSARRKRSELAPEGEELAEADALRQRVAVLERIVTDPANRLDREIEHLRSAS